MIDIGFEDTRDDEGYGEDDTDERARSGDPAGCHSCYCAIYWGACICPTRYCFPLAVPYPTVQVINPMKPHPITISCGSDSISKTQLAT
ncbi:hypothetical protein CIP107507_00466 [Corynebacterium diphtheriae]|nr:hypothetical protein CIP107507_00466 [Corynebacterium diphtheriae]